MSMNNVLLFGMPGAAEWVFILIGVIFFIAYSALWVYALVDCARSRFKDSNSQLIWILAIVFFSPIGLILYFVIGRSAKVASY